MRILWVNRLADTLTVFADQYVELLQNNRSVSVWRRSNWTGDIPFSSNMVAAEFREDTRE